jgi:hypothetical protein
MFDREKCTQKFDVCLGEPFVEKNSPGSGKTFNGKTRGGGFQLADSGIR